ncbi:MAG: alpha/beta hydrolase [Ruminococcus sp.]|nr:alpha/beta hydrolase [Ruminococcus sp.]
MKTLFIILAIVAGIILLTVIMSLLIANVLFKKVIPRQDGVKVNMDEMADAEKWQEYMKVIQPNKDFMLSLPCEHVTVKSNDGLTLHGDYYPAEKPSDNLVICFHGYTSARMSSCSFAAYMHKLGFDCLLVDNRAHGDSEGEYIGFGILDRHDCISWIEYVNEKFDSKKNILLYGVSMGATTIMMAAADKKIPANVKALVADCGFTSPYEVFCHVLKKDYKLSEFPIMNFNNVICRKKAGYGFKDYSTLTAVKETDKPILFIHGEEDNFVPVWMTKKNYEECVSDKDILLVPNAAHGASYYENPSLYQEKVSEFTGKYFNI